MLGTTLPSCTMKTLGSVYMSSFNKRSIWISCLYLYFVSVARRYEFWRA